MTLDEIMKADTNNQWPDELQADGKRALSLWRRIRDANMTDWCSFKTDLFVIWSEDSSEKLIIRCRVLEESVVSGKEKE
jgi:DNA-directed RNA polymerase II subunit RPB1